MTIDLFREIEARHGHAIHSLEDLREYLEIALAVEQATLPPYLTALYSIRPGSNSVAAQTLRAVAMEEMLHMVLVGNLLVALGGVPRLTDSRFVLHYPSRLPHAAASLRVGLEKFSRASVKTFMAIERPAAIDAPPQSDGYHTLGQFYHALMAAFTSEPVRGEITHYWADHPPTATIARQFGPAQFYGSEGIAICVTDFTSALRALEEIVHQGEGFIHREQTGDGARSQDKEPWEAAHYYRFEQLWHGRAYQPDDIKEHPSGPFIPTDWSAVAKLRPNARIADYRRVNSPAVPRLLAFNHAYTRVLAGIQAAFTGDAAALQDSVAAMLQLRVQAAALMNIPSGFDDGTVAAPTFELAANLN